MEMRTKKRISVGESGSRVVSGQAEGRVGGGAGGRADGGGGDRADENDGDRCQGH